MSLRSWKLAGLAALVAAGTTLATMGPAAAITPSLAGLASQSQTGTTGNVVKAGVVIRVNPWWHGRRRYRARRPGFGYYYGGYWYARPYWRVPAPVPRPRAYGGRHVRWCLNHYRTYNPATNLFVGHDGRHHPCRSPF